MIPGAATLGATALSIRCHRDEHLPYAPIAEALREALTSRVEDEWLNGVPPYWRAEAMRLVPNLGPGPNRRSSR